VVNTLRNAIEKNRLAHAYMFAGPRGVGKTSCARILAKALNCKSGTTPNPCGKCPSCLDIAAGRSLDVMEIDGASNRGIDEIRSLRESVKFAPASGRYKVYIIDEVHQITPDGFNALLKTLEEPPEFVKFILATTQPQKVPSTIMSRCQRMDFRRISVLEIIAQLERIIGSEGGKVDREVLFAVARASDGALRDAESILDQLLSFSKDAVSLEDVVSMLGTVQLNVLFDLTDSVLRQDIPGLLTAINSIIDKGKDPAVLLQDLIMHFRNLMVAKVAGNDPRLIDLPDELCVRLVEQAQGFSLEELFSAFTVLLETQDMARRMESLRIPLEINLVRLCRQRGMPKGATPERPAAQSKPYVLKPKPPQAISSPKPSQAPQQSAPSPAPEPPEPPQQQPPAAPGVSFDQVKDGWENFINEVGRSRMSMATYLKEGTLEAKEGSVLTVSFPRDLSFHKESLEKKEHKSLLEKFLLDSFGSGLRLSFRLTDESRPSHEDVKNPAVRSALDLFKGRVV
jgi:DNA polymerase-3 subunit gamma/tau